MSDAFGELIARLEKLEGPCRETEQDIYCELGLCPHDDDGILQAYRAPYYTLSIDAAVALVERMLPDSRYRVEKSVPALTTCQPYWASAGFPGEQEAAEGPTAAIALTLALLKAKHSQEKENG